MYKNPIIEGADPFLLQWEGRYYHFATNSDQGFRVYSSVDLNEWRDEGFALEKGEGVMGDQGFWAPEIKFYDGKFYMVYVANEHIAVATATSPAGPYKCEKMQWLSEEKAIDGSYFIDDDGKIYMYYVRFDNANVIYGAPMADMSTLLEEKEVELIRATLPWETRMANVVEGPFVLKHDGKYYLTYSANHFLSQDYAVGYAVSDNPMGPFKKFEGNPILKKDGIYFGPGHHSFSYSPKGELMIVYHIHNSDKEVGPRLTCVDKACFEKSEDGALDVLKINVVHGNQEL